MGEGGGKEGGQTSRHNKTYNIFFISMVTYNKKMSKTTIVDHTPSPAICSKEENKDWEGIIVTL